MVEHIIFVPKIAFNVKSFKNKSQIIQDFILILFRAIK